MSDKTKTKTIRFPVALEKTILKDAKKSSRDFTKQVLHILQQHYGEAK
jgi:hypothetical protein